MRVKVLFLILALLVGIAAVFMSIQMEANSVGDFSSYDDGLVAHEIKGVVGVAGPPIVATQSSYVSAIPATQAQAFNSPAIRSTVGAAQQQIVPVQKPATPTIGVKPSSYNFGISNSIQQNSTGVRVSPKPAQPGQVHSLPNVSTIPVIGPPPKPSVTPVQNSNFLPIDNVRSVPGQNRTQTLSNRIQFPNPVQSSAFKPRTKRAIPVSTKPSSPFSKNAEEIQYLVRAQYKLPAEAAQTLEKFFAFDESNKVETKILPTESKKLINFQVTTDSETQKAISQFLNATYSAERIKAIEVGTTMEETDGVQSVSLKLPGMTCAGCEKAVCDALKSIGATEIETDVPERSCEFSLPDSVDFETEIGELITDGDGVRLQGWSFADDALGSQ